MTKQEPAATAAIDAAQLEKALSTGSVLRRWCREAMFSALLCGVMSFLFLSEDPLRAALKNLAGMMIFWSFFIAHTLSTQVRAADAAGIALNITKRQRDALRLMSSTRIRVLAVVVWLITLTVGLQLLQRIPTSFLLQAAPLIYIGFGLCCCDLIYHSAIAADKPRK